MAEFKLGRIKFVYQGTWQNGQPYVVDDVVTVGGKTYICTITNTSSSTFAQDLNAIPSYWNLIADGTQWKDAWTASTPYNAGDMVLYGGIVYICKTAHTSATFISPTWLGLEQDSGKWDAFAASFNWIGAWTANTRYKVRDLVYYGGVTYVCNTKHVSASSATDGLELNSGYWDTFNQGINYLGDWSGSSVRYKQNDVVKFGADLWICTQYHTSTGTTINGSYFSIFVNGFQFENSWSASGTYQVGDIVTYGGYTYTAIQNSTSSSPKVPSTQNTYWKVFTSGLEFSGEWDSGTDYKIGQVVSVGGYTYVAAADNTASEPPSGDWSKLNSGIRWNSAPSTTYNGVTGVNVNGAGTGNPAFDITLTGTSYSATVVGGSAGAGYSTNNTIKILGTDVGGISPANDLILTVNGVNTGAITSVGVSSGYAVTWQAGMTYVAGDAVYFGSNSYICISAHVGSGGNRPDTDITATYWNILAAGQNPGVLTTQGDIVYYGNAGPQRLPIGQDGQVLRVNNNIPEWSYYGLIDNIVYVAQNGVDEVGAGRGLTIDKPWGTLLYACKQVEEGYLHTNAGMLMQMNKQFMMKEVNNYILKNYTYTISGVTSNTFTVSSSAGTTGMYSGMPIIFSTTTANVTAGTIYYVVTSDSTHFRIASSYALATAASPTTLSLTSPGVANVATFSYTQSKAERDTATVLDAIIFDLTHGGNYKISTATQQYFKTITSYVTNNATYEMAVWIDSLNYLRTLFESILTNTDPDNNYQELNGVALSTRAVQNINTAYTAETGTLVLSQDLIDILIDALAAGTYANLPLLQRPHTSVYLKTGTYNEYGPIVVPLDTAILGDELRSTIVQVAGPQPYLANDKPKTISAISRMKELIPAIVNNIPVIPSADNTVSQTFLGASYSDITQTIATNTAIIETILAGGLSAVPGAGTTTVVANTVSYTVPNTGTFTFTTPTGYGSTLVDTAYACSGNATGATTGYDNALSLISANYNFIQAEIAAYLYAYTGGGFSWSALSSNDKSRSLRDVAYTLDAITYDLRYGGNTQSLKDGDSYYSEGVNQITPSSNVSATAAVLARIKTVVGQIATNTSVTPTSGNAVSQVTGSAGSAYASTFAQNRVQDILDYFNTGAPNARVEPSKSWMSTATLAAFNNIQSRKADIQMYIQNWVDRTYPTLSISSALTYRDAGTIVDALSYDVLLGTTFYSVISGRAYYRVNASAQALVGGPELAITEDAINYIGYMTALYARDPASAYQMAGSIASMAMPQAITTNTNLVQTILAGGLTAVPGYTSTTRTITITAGSYTALGYGTFTLSTPTGYNTSSLTNTAYACSGNATGDTTGYGYGVIQIAQNISFLQTEIAAYLNSYTTGGFSWSGLTATQRGQSLRDVAYLLSSIQYDMTYGGNSQCQIDGLAYFSIGNSSVPTTTAATVAALTRLQTILPYIVTKNTGSWSKTTGNNASQVVTGTAGSTNAGVYAAALVGQVITIINSGAGNSLSEGNASTGVVLPYTGWASTTAQTAFANIQAQKSYLQQRIRSWVANTYPNTVADLALTYRDAGTIIDALSYDMVLGSNYFSMVAGRAYYRFDASAQALVGSAELTATQQAIYNISYNLCALAAKATSLPVLAGDLGSAKAVQSIVNNAAIIQNIFQNGIIQEPAFTIPQLTGYNTTWLAGYGDGLTQLVQNYQFIKDEIINYLNNTLGNPTWPNYGTAYQAETVRDLSNILDALQYDMTYGCNDQSMIAGRAFYSLNTALITSAYSTGVTNALTRLSAILSPIIQGVTLASVSLAASAGNNTSQVTTGTGGSVAAAAFAQARIADILYWLANGAQDESSATFTGSISSTTLTVSSITGTIKIGQIVTGGTVAAGTYITAGSGTSWTVSKSQSATATGSTITITPVISGAYSLVNAEVQTAFNAVQTAKLEIQRDAQAWVTRFYQNESPNLVLTLRDPGYIVDALSYDMLLGSNFNSIINGRAFQRLIPSITRLRANFADSTYGAIGFIAKKAKQYASTGSIVQVNTTVDDMVEQIYGQPTASAVFNGTISGTILTINSVTSGTIATGLSLSGIGITSGTVILSGSGQIAGSTWLLNYNQNVSSLTTVATKISTSIVLNGTTYTNVVTLGTTEGLVPGLSIQFTGTAIGNLSAGTYYVCQVLSTTQLTISSTYNNSVSGTPFTLTSTTTGSMVTTAYGIYGGLGVTTNITASTTIIPVTGVNASTNAITVSSNAGMYINMPIVFSSLPASVAVNALQTISSGNLIKVSTTSGLVVGQKIYFTGPSIGGLVFNQIYYIKTIPTPGTNGTITVSLTLGGAAVAVTSTSTLSSVQITGTAGQLSCSSTPLVVGQPITISGTLSSGGFLGFGTSQTYYIIATNGTTTFTLSETLGGIAVGSTASSGVITGATFGLNDAMVATANTAGGLVNGNVYWINSIASGTYPAAGTSITVSDSYKSGTDFVITNTLSGLTAGATAGVACPQGINDKGVNSSAQPGYGVTAYNSYSGYNNTVNTISGSELIRANIDFLANEGVRWVQANFGGTVTQTNSTGNVITTSTPHNLTVGDPIQFTATTVTTTATQVSGNNITVGTTAGMVAGMPFSVNGILGNLSSGTVYYVLTATGTTVTVANSHADYLSGTPFAVGTASASVTATVGGVFGGATTTNSLTQTVQVYWVLTTPSKTTFTVSVTQPGTGTQSPVSLVTAYGVQKATYFMLVEKAVRDASYYLNALIYDINYTGNYKSLRFIQVYLSAQGGSQATDLFHVRNGTGIRNMTLNGMSGSLAVPNSYGTRRPTAGSYSSLDPGSGPNDNSVWGNVRSCYIQNVTNFGSGCVGMKIDAALHNGGNRSILANDYTQVLSDGIGVWCTGHGALTECVSVFAYYNYSGYLAEFGGRIRATNGNSSYGNYGVIAEGIDSYETPVYATLNNRANPAYITNTVTDGTNQILRLEFNNAGSSYTNYSPSISGTGYNVIALGDELRDSSVFETRIIDGNNGQGVGGSNYLTNSNTAQPSSFGNIVIANTDTQLSSAYVGMRVQVTGGTGVGQYANILSYSNGIKTALVYRPTFTPLTILSSTTSTFTVADTTTLYANQAVYIGQNFANLSTGTLYYVVGASLTATTFSVSTASSGSATLLTAASGTFATSGSSIVGTTFTVGTLDSGTIYVGMLLSGGTIAANTYISANISGSGAGSTWTVTVSQSVGSSSISGSIAVSLVAAGWDHIVPGTAIQNVLDLTSTYIIEPAISYTSPGFTSTARTMSGSNVSWYGLAYGAGNFVATANGSTATSYSTTGKSWTAGGAMPLSTAWTRVTYGGGQGAAAVAIVGGSGGSGASLTAVIGTGAASGQIVSITVNTGGYNYSSPPTILITPVSGGSGATATARILNGSITVVDMVTTGANYTNGATVTVITSQLSSITATTWGKDYYIAPTVTIAPPYSATVWASGGTATQGVYYSNTTITGVTYYYLATSGGTFATGVNTTVGPITAGNQTNGTVSLTYVGTLAVATANLTNNGVSSFNLTNAGYGYLSAPTITITDPQAVFVAISTSSTASNSSAYQIPTALGSTWLATQSTTGLADLKGLAYGNNLYIAVGGTSTTPSAASLSGNPKTTAWTNRSVAGITGAVSYSAVAYGNLTFVAVPVSGQTTTTTLNGSTWTAGGNLTSSTSWIDVAYGNGRFVALAANGTVNYSIDKGATWAAATGAGLGNTITWSALSYGQGQFMAVATSPTPTITASTATGNWLTLSSTTGLVVGNQFTPSVVTETTTASATTHTTATSYSNAFISNGTSGNAGTILTAPTLSGTFILGMTLTGGSVTAGTYISASNPFVSTGSSISGSTLTIGTLSSGTISAGQAISITGFSNTNAMIAGGYYPSGVQTGVLMLVGTSTGTAYVGEILSGTGISNNTTYITSAGTASSTNSSIATSSTSTFTGSIDSSGVLTITSAPTGAGTNIGMVITGGSIATGVWIVSRLTGTPTASSSTWQTTAIASQTSTTISARSYVLTIAGTLTNTFYQGMSLAGLASAGTYITGQVTATAAAVGSQAYSSGGAAGATTITLAAGTGFAVGQLITGTGILANTYITNVATATITISQALHTQAGGTYSSYNAGIAGTYYVNIAQDTAAGTISGSSYLVTAGSGTVLPTSTITGALNLYITANLSGSGSGSTWTLNSSATVSSTTVSGQSWTVSVSQNRTAFTVVGTSDLITVGSNAGMTIGEPITFAGTGFGNISTGTTYYITEVLSNGTQVAIGATFGATTNTTLTTATGSLTVTAGAILGNLVSGQTYYIYSINSGNSQIQLSPTNALATVVTLIDDTGAWTSVAGPNYAATSWDGINWKLNLMPSSSNWQKVKFGNPSSGSLGSVPTWVAVSSSTGNKGASIATGATPLGRMKVTNSTITEIRMVEPGSGYPRGNVTATTDTTNVITSDDTTNLIENQPITFAGTSQGGITTGIYYYVVGGSITSSQFQVSTTAGGTAIVLSTAVISSMTYAAGPIITQTDPNKVNTAPLVPRIGNGALGNPSFNNRGTANTTATSSVSGDGYADLYQATASVTGTYINVSGLYQIPTAGSNVTFSSIPNTWYKLVAVTNILGSPGNYTATFQINPGLSVLLAPPHGTLITTNLLYSNVRLTGHDFLYIGTGNFTSTNYPNVDPTKAVQANQQLATGGGRVFFTSTDQDGNFNVGNLFGVQQSTGTATLNASAFNLSGLQSLTLGSVNLGVGSATITSFSTDPYFTANSDSVVPTQKAIKSFITSQIGGGASSLNVNSVTAGQIKISGNTIENTTGNQIIVSSRMNFTGGIDGAPVALVFFGQK